MSGQTLPPVGPSQVRPQDIDYSSLGGTLPAVFALLGLGQAQQQQAADEIHAQSQRAAQQAQGAFQNYQQAASTPAPQAGQVPNMWDQLAGGAASIISRNPQYAQQAQQRGADINTAQSDARDANLKALRDLYEKQALAAEQMGKLDLASQIRSKITSVDNTRGKLAEQAMGDAAKNTLNQNAAAYSLERTQTQGNQAMDLERLRQQGRERIEQMKGNLRMELEKQKGANVPPDYLENAVIHTDSGDVVDTSGLVGNAKNALIQAAYRSGMVPVDKDQKKVLDDIQGAKQNVLTILQQAEQALPENPADRAQWAAKVWMARATQSDPFVVAFDNWRSGAIKNLRATAGSGGLRINQKEIDLAVKYDIPSIFDTKAVARQKMLNIMTMLTNGERVATSHNWRQQNAVLQKQASFPANKVTVMAPDGSTKEVTAAEANNLIGRQGYARVVNPEWAFGGEQPEIPNRSGGAAKPAASPAPAAGKGDPLGIR